ncbi:EAL domain-containing protein [Rossellomorea vietnamensis]|uniref:histidine kinase n=1 Tax=Rossellomorea vietnamensis TaxID=218284 RepID=A0A5D4MB41_9BACI|nr:EAL domain-containing protein [Rossellomorea vietnamensis]TYR98856.1 EAL domain-containing protein [Rossellomorea vietnamensis]
MKDFITIFEGAAIEKVSKNLYYQNLFERFPDALFLLDTEGRFIDVNEGLEELTKYPKDRLLFSHFSQYIHQEDLHLVKGYFADALEGEVQKREFRIVQKDGGIRHVSITVTAAQHKETVIGVFGTAKDITENKKLEQMINDSHGRFESLIRNSTDAIGILDESGIMTYQSPSVTKVMGYSPDEMIGKSCYEYVMEEDVGYTKSLFNKAMSFPNETIKGEFRMVKSSKEVIHCEASVTNLLADKKVNGIVVNYRDITERKEQEKEIKHRAYHDYLTGLPNRYMLEAMLEKHIHVCEQRGQTLAILFMDLDRFKVINDSMGHPTGDSLLRQASCRFQRELEKGSMLFRHSGDEFIIIQPDADAEKAQELARNIQKSMSEPFVINQYEIYCSISIGVTICPVDGRSVEELIKHADFAMYQAKKAGNNSIQLFSSTKQKEKFNPLKLEIEMHKALDKNEFILHYQPKVNLRTGKTIGFEALMRWHHSDWGLISPEAFIPIAEDSGLIIPIGEWALSEACRQNKIWHEEGLKTTVSVNLSPRQFSQVSLVDTIKKVLKETRLEPQYLELEITESMTADLNRAIETLKALKTLGIKISIDDFGTGFSSLNYLKRFPVDTLKIDQSFVKELHNNPSDETIVKTIISMAHHLNLNVVAEGIETKEQLLFLQQHLCDEGQGYFLCKPQLSERIQLELDRIHLEVQKNGLSYEHNEKMWAEEMIRSAKRELHETLRLQQGGTLKFKKMEGRFIHTFCEGELLYKAGFIPEQILGKELNDFLPKEIADQKKIDYERAWQGENDVSYEGYANGIHYLANLRPIIRGGIVEEVIISLSDMTEQKKTEEALRESEKKYRLIAENMSDLISIIDLEGNLHYASPSHNLVLGYNSLQEVPGMSNVFDFIHPEDLPEIEENLKLVHKLKQPLSVEFRYARKSGGWVLLETSVTPVLGPDGKVTQLIAVGRDITEKREAEKLLWNSEKLSIVGELAAGVAHEIRNPITSIKGFIQLIQKGVIKEEYFKIILEEFHRIECIVSEFLALAKPQVISLRPVDPVSVLEDVRTLLSSEANLRNAVIDLKLDKKLNLLHCDENQLKQVFINLLKNGLEALPEGGTVEVKSFSSGKEAIFQVIDNGVGICEERIKKLGEPFYSNKEKGTGLGLMLCFRIIKQHKGSICVKSIEGEGTTVEFRLPLPAKSTT